MNKAPSVMVSSTFYDLRQVRADLTSFFVDQLGYRPLLSELSSFPVDPDSDTIENCKKRVEEDADILVLIVGGRYGSVHDKTSKSITNLEYLVARAKGIPIFVFIQRSVLDVLPIWKNNKSADFSSSVDDTRLFGFIEQIRDTDRIWTFGFQLAQDIIDVLRTQFAYLMDAGLSLRFRLKDQAIPRDSTLSGESLRIAIEKPAGWEHRLFAQSLVDQINALGDMKRDYELGLILGERPDVPIMDFLNWLQTRLSEIKQIIDNLTKLIPDAMNEAFGPLGQPGNVEAILFVTRRLASVYQESIEWSFRVKRASIDEKLEPVRVLFAHFTAKIIDQLTQLGPTLLARIKETLALPEDQRKTIQMSISVDLPNVEEFTRTWEATFAEIMRDIRNGTA